MRQHRERTPEEALEALTSDPYEDERRNTRYHARAYLGEAVGSSSCVRTIIVVERKRRKLKGIKP